MKHIRLFVVLVYLSTFLYQISYSQHIYTDGANLMLNGCQIYMNGANTPWNNWNDFGGNYSSSFWSSHFSDLKAKGINSSRIWISCDGAGQPYVASDGTVSQPTQAFWDDMDDMLASAEANGIYVMATVMSFDHFDEAKSNHIGWRTMVQSASKTQTFIDNYLVPLVNRYKDNPYLYCIDLCNEPEWIHENATEGQIGWTNLQRFFGMCAAAIHTSNSPVLVSVGSAATKWNSPAYSDGNQWSDANLQAQSGSGSEAYLDIWHFHYYDWINQYFSNPFQKSPADYQLQDRPCVVGEMPGIESELPSGITMNTAFANMLSLGYAGHYPWTSNGVDTYGDLNNFGASSLTFYTANTNLVTATCNNSNNANLLTLQVSEGDFTPAFNKNVFSYTLYVPITATKPTVSATAEDSNADVTITQAATSDGEATVSVLANDGVTNQVYTIDFVQYTPVLTSMQITPSEVNLQAGASQDFAVVLYDQAGNEISGSVTWSPSGGGTLSALSGPTTTYTSNAATGVFSVTASAGGIDSVATITVSNGVVITEPLATDWIAVNAWNNQNSGTGVSNENSALKVTHIQWGYGLLYLINSGTGIDLESGKDYDICFDFQDDATNPVTSITVGFGDNWTSEITNTNSTTFQVTSGITSNDFSQICGTVTASSTGTSHLYIVLSWGADPANDKPNAEYYSYIKNLTIYPEVTIVDSDNDGTPDNVDGCPNDPNKIAPGECGCGVVEGTCSQTISFEVGWNLISFSNLPADKSIAVVLTDLNFDIVKDENGFYKIGNDGKQSITEFEVGKGYLVYSNEIKDITVTGEINPLYTTTTLQAGWNMVGVPVQNSLLVSALPAQVITVKDFESFYEQGNGLSTLPSLDNTKGYYVYATGACTITW